MHGNLFPNPGVSLEALSNFLYTWNVHTKNTLKCSNISVKKYQNNPMLGVSSGTERMKP